MKNVFLLLLIASAAAFGQTAAGTLVGLVTDPSGAIIANAPVVATHVETGTRLVATTSETGNYTIAQMPVGRYQVTVAQQGFKTFRQENVIIQAAQTLRLDVKLDVGAATETVTVTSESTLLQSDSGALVHNINPLQIQELPIFPATGFVRDPLQMVMVLPGSVYSGLAGIVDRVNGLPTTTMEYKVDGEPVTNTQAPTITTRNNMSPDSLQEVAIQTSNFNAEYGAVSGTLFNMIIKSGTNTYHGTAYDYLANDDFNARDAVTHTRSQLRRNDFGFNIGGPVRIPWLYNGKDKTFFFFNWEDYRDYGVEATTTFATVPTAAYRQGIFNSLVGLPGNTGNLHIGAAAPGGHDYRDPLGNVIPLGTIFDPNSTQTVTCNTALTTDCSAGQVFNNYRTPLPNNNLPMTYIDPVAAKILSKYVPLPSGPNANLLTNNYLNPVRTTRFTSSPALKIDQNVGSKARIGFSYANNSTSAPIQTLGGLAEGFPEPITGNSGTQETAPVFRVNFDYTIKPTMLFHWGVGWQEYNFCACPITTNYNAASDIGLVGATSSMTSFPLMGSTVVSSPVLGGLKNLSTAGPSYTLDRHPSTSANVTWVTGKHTVKIGAEFRIDATVFPVLTGTAGNYTSFGAGSATSQTNGITSQPALSTASGFTGNTDVGFPFANWLMGSVTSFSLSDPVEVRKTKLQTGLFLQDTWRIRRNLTLDYGVRWDYGTYAKEDYGRVADLSLTTPNPAAGNRLGGYIYEASCGCQFAKNYPYAIGPRVGIAYTLDKKTVIRGGAGVAYDATGFTGGGVINSSSSATPANGFDLFKFAQGVPASLFPAGVQTSNPSAGFTVGASSGALAGLIDPNAGRPDRTYQWKASLQREITRNLLVEVAYVGNENIWQPTGGFQDFNAISPALLQSYGFQINTSAQGILDEQLLNTRLNSLSMSQASTLASRGIFLPYSGFSSTTPQTVLQSLKNFPQFTSGISPGAPQGKSWYDALQVTVTKRFSHGLSATAAYTFSKNEQYTSSPDIFNTSPNYGKDIVGANPPQSLHIAFEYRVPRYKGSMAILSNKIVSYALSDWGVSGAMYYQSGAYIGRPLNGATFPISLWLGRGPGSAQLLKNADGTYMNPWSVNWYDLNGVHHTTPLDINCHCFDPATTVVLNPAAWGVVPDAQFAAQTAIIQDFRGPRHPTENMNFARNFTIKEKYTLQIRMEFLNVFNRVQLPSPSTGFSPTNIATSYTTAPNGNFTNGFGTFGNSTIAGYLGSAGGPRTGQLVGRFTF